MIGFDDTLHCLRVESLGDDRYTARNIPMDYRRVFGGQLLAQCIAIGSNTAPGKQVKSIHATFPREGDLGREVVFRVERTQDGRSFAGRLIVGEQGERTIATASVSLHAQEAGLEHADAVPRVAGPDDCVPTELSMIPWETRVVDAVDLADRGAGPPGYAFWMRTPPVEDDPAIHQALLGHATILTLIGTALRPHAGVGEADVPARVQTAVTSHTLWFHASLRVDDWLLVSQRSPRAGGGRGFGLGHVYTRAGTLVASFAQESLIRPVAAASD